MIVHSALAAHDVEAARAWRDTMNATMYRGEALGHDLQTLAAGIAALEGRRSDALSQFREALAGYRALGLAFDEALTVLDMVSLLGAGEPDVQTAADWARTTFTRLGARPLLERLDAGMSGSPQATTEPSTDLSVRAAAESVTATPG